MTDPKTAKPKRGYWYRFTSFYCPICTASRDYKERVYDEPKPEKWEERHEIIDSWDYCDAL